MEGRLDIGALAVEAETTVERLVYGATVIVAGRVAGQAGAGVILATEAVRAECAGTDLVFEARGEATLKGVPAPVTLFEVHRAHTSSQ